MTTHHTDCLITKATDLRPVKGYEQHDLVRSKGSGLVFMRRIPSLAKKLKQSEWVNVTSGDLIRRYTYARDLARYIDEKILGIA